VKKPSRIQKSLLFERVKKLTTYILLISKANVKTTVAEGRQLVLAYDTHTEA
jgi:hypothetical protein